MGGKGSGNHKPDRRRKAAELRARGLSLAEIGRAMGMSKQAAHQLLGYRGRRGCGGRSLRARAAAPRWGRPCPSTAASPLCACRAGTAARGHPRRAAAGAAPRGPAVARPARPRPLFPHATGQRANKIRGRNRLAKRYGRHRLGTRSQCVRSAFMHAFDSGYLARRTTAGWFADLCRVVPGPRGRGASADHQRQVHRRGRATVCVRRPYRFAPLRIQPDLMRPSSCPTCCLTRPAPGFRQTGITTGRGPIPLPDPLRSCSARYNRKFRNTILNDHVECMKFAKICEAICAARGLARADGESIGIAGRAVKNGCTAWGDWRAHNSAVILIRPVSHGRKTGFSG
jgi:hypothetical protein